MNHKVFIVGNSCDAKSMYKYSIDQQFQYASAGIWFVLYFASDIIIINRNQVNMSSDLRRPTVEIEPAIGALLNRKPTYSHHPRRHDAPILFDSVVDHSIHVIYIVPMNQCNAI